MQSVGMGEGAVYLEWNNQGDFCPFCIFILCIFMLCFYYFVTCGGNRAWCVTAAGLLHGHHSFSSLRALTNAPIQRWSLFPLEPGWLVTCFDPHNEAE